MIVDFDRQGWAHMWAGLRAHVGWCRSNAILVPCEVHALMELADRKRRGDATERHGAPKVADTVDLAQASSVLTINYDEAARRLGVSRRTVQRLVASGELPTVELGGACRVRTADLVAYVDGLAPRHSGFRDDVRTKKVAS